MGIGWAGVGGPRPPAACRHTAAGGPSSSLSRLIFNWRQGDVIFCPIPSWKKRFLAASARQGSPCPGGVPSAQPDPDPGDAVCGRARWGTPGHPRGTLGARRSTPRRWVCGVTCRNCLTNGLSPLFPGCLLCNWNESYQQNTTKPIHWILNEYLRCLSFPSPVGKKTPTP